MTAIAALLDLVPGWIWAIVVAVMLALGVTQSMHVGLLKSQLAGERQAHADTKFKYSEAARVAEVEARKRESDLQAFADQLRKTKDAQIAALRSDVRALRDSLSNLPTRPAGDPGAATAGFGQAAPGCAGPVLYRDTAEALAGEAERADLIRLNLKACYSAWDAAAEVMQKASP